MKGMVHMSAIVLASTENMSHDEWLRLRRQGIGGSDASVVCGISRYKSPMELWLDKTNQLPIRKPEKPHIGVQYLSLW